MVESRSNLYLDLLEIITETYKSELSNSYEDYIINIKSNDIDKYYLRISNGECKVLWGNHPLASTSYYGPILTFINILRKEIDPVKSILSDSIQVEGDIALLINIRNSFMITKNKNIDNYYSKQNVYRGPLKIENRFIFFVFMLVNIFTLIVNNIWGLYSFLSIVNFIPIFIILYLFLYSKVQLKELILVFFNIAMLCFYFFKPDISSNTLFVLYNFYMLTVFSWSLFFERTFLSFFNTVNINGTEYFDKKINNHQSNINLHWIMLNIWGLAWSIIPWSTQLLSNIVLYIYFILLSILLIYTYKELKSC